MLDREMTAPWLAPLFAASSWVRNHLFPGTFVELHPPQERSDFIIATLTRLASSIEKTDPRRTAFEASDSPNFPGTSILKPWVLDAKTLELLHRLPDDQYEDGYRTIDALIFNSFRVSSFAVMIIYAAFIALACVATFQRVLAALHPSFYCSCRQRLQRLRSLIFESPTATKRHSQPVQLLQTRWLTLQVPLRYQTILLATLLAANIAPLVTFWRFYPQLPGQTNIFFPEPHSVRNQRLRYLADRCALMAIGQVPLLILMAGRRSPVAMLTGLSMNDLMLYHRWIARFVWTHVAIHSACFSALRLLKHEWLEMFFKAYWNFGVLGFTMFCGLTFLSLRVFRVKHYEVFVFLHIAMAFVGLVAAFLHIRFLHSSRFEVLMLMVEASGILWLCDRTIRLMNRFVTSFVSLSPPHLRTSRGTVTFLNKDIIVIRAYLPASRVKLRHEKRAAGWLPDLLGGKIGAGDDVTLTIPRLQMVGDHPFTVFATGVSESDADQRYLDIAIKAKRGITKKLLSLRRGSGDRLATESESEDEAARLLSCAEQAGPIQLQNSVLVLVEGPYGHRPKLEQEHLLLICGGIGITFTFPYLMQAAYRSRRQTIKLVWVIREENLVDLIRPQLLQLAGELAGETATRIFIDIHVTQPSAKQDFSAGAGAARDYGSIARTGPRIRDSVGLDQSSGNSDGRIDTIAKQVSPQIELRWTASRPIGYADRAEELILACTASPSEGTGEGRPSLAVVSCGPEALCDDVRLQAIAWRNQRRWRDVVYHEECFTW